MSDYDPEYIARYNPDQAAIRADERRRVADELERWMDRFPAVNRFHRKDIAAELDRMRGTDD